MSTESQKVLNQGGFPDAATAQDSFARQFDVERPEQAMSSYQKIMHEHTKQQFEMATASSSRRRSSASSEVLSPTTSASPRNQS